jgi:uncharacterized membrane protein
MKRAILLAATASLALSGCFGFKSIEEDACPAAGTKLTWDNFGKAFFANNCNYCHSADEGDRQGAPGTYVFETVEQVRAHTARIYVRSASSNDSMPPGPDDPPRAERDKLAEWLVCGAK